MASFTASWFQWFLYIRSARLSTHAKQAIGNSFARYITFIVFAVIAPGPALSCERCEVIRVITAIFLRETLEAANNDAELMVQEGLRRKATYIHKLESSLCSRIWADCDIRSFMIIVFSLVRLGNRLLCDTLKGRDFGLPSV